MAAVWPLCYHGPAITETEHTSTVFIKYCYKICISQEDFLKYTGKTDHTLHQCKCDTLSAFFFSHRKINTKSTAFSYKVHCGTCTSAKRSGNQKFLNLTIFSCCQGNTACIFLQLKKKKVLILCIKYKVHKINFWSTEGNTEKAAWKCRHVTVIKVTVLWYNHILEFPGGLNKHSLVFSSMLSSQPADKSFGAEALLFVASWNWPKNTKQNREVLKYSTIDAALSARQLCNF